MRNGRRRFSDRFLAELRDRVPLGNVVGRHVRLVRQGRELVGLCAFHEERSPSFAVVETKGFYIASAAPLTAMRSTSLWRWRTSISSTR